ncbi:MAG: hypothetical protein ACKOHM_12405 [Spartobacteria bacterium]
MEQLVLLLIIGAISLINWLIEQSGKRREQRRFEQERARRQAAEPNPYLEPAPTPASAHELPEPTPQQEMRKFLEAFGIPVPEEPAPPIAPQEIQPPVPQEKFEPEPVQPAPRPKRKVTPLQTHQPVAITKSPATLRQAIIWREILGPPRSLQS